jgi:hypothetical protein
MTLGDVLGIALGIIGIAIAFVGVTMAMTIWFPQVTHRAQQRVQGSFWVCLGVGVLLALTLGVLSVGLISASKWILKLVGVLMFFGLSSMIFVGAAGMARMMGERINAMAEPLTPFAGVLRGSVILSMAMLFPFVGWLLIMPVVGLCAFGAGALALRRKREVPVVRQEIAQPITFEETKVALEEAGVLR